MIKLFLALNNVLEKVQNSPPNCSLNSSHVFCMNPVLQLVHRALVTSHRRVLYVAGDIVMVVPMPEGGATEGWTDIGGGQMAAKMFRFLQRDINEGRIWYQHNGGTTNSDFFRFEVSSITASSCLQNASRSFI